MKKIFVFSMMLLLLLLVLQKTTAQQFFDITLRLNYSATAIVYHNEPLLLTVALSNKEAEENSRWNKAADRALNELEQQLNENKIEKEAYDKEKARLTAGKKKLNSKTLGSKRNPWVNLVKWKLVNTGTGAEIAFSAKPLVNPSTLDIAILDEQAYYISYFGIDSDEMKSLPAASYSIVAQIEGETSKLTYLEIKNEEMTAAVAETDDMLLKTGQFYWHKNDGDKTIAYAERLMKKNANSLDGLSLKADGEFLKQSYAASLGTYTKALKLYYSLNGKGAEPPEYLTGMIEVVKDKLGLSKN